MDTELVKAPNALAAQLPTNLLPRKELLLFRGLLAPAEVISVDLEPRTSVDEAKADADGIISALARELQDLELKSLERDDKIRELQEKIAWMRRPTDPLARATSAHEALVSYYEGMSGLVVEEMSLQPSRCGSGHDWIAHCTYTSYGAKQAFLFKLQWQQEAKGGEDLVMYSPRSSGEKAKTVEPMDPWDGNWTFARSKMHEFWVDLVLAPMFEDDVVRTGKICGHEV
ncbi:hypothetical protein MKEN_00804900 [Mycena kentingensis (nom. inval.)]|nr:hypothetical protein MKEN_00804900 [Mycena kentingensis (nom. inval.)]